MIEVEKGDHQPTDSDLDTCVVYTTDATGRNRVYRIHLTAERLDDGHIMAGRRIDGEHSDRERPTSPSERAWDAAREHFRDLDYEVHG